MLSPIFGVSDEGGPCIFEPPNAPNPSVLKTAEQELRPRSDKGGNEPPSLIPDLFTFVWGLIQCTTFFSI